MLTHLCCAEVCYPHYPGLSNNNNNNNTYLCIYFGIYNFFILCVFSLYDYTVQTFKRLFCPKLIVTVNTSLFFLLFLYFSLHLPVKHTVISFCLLALLVVHNATVYWITLFTFFFFNLQHFNLTFESLILPFLSQ